MVTTYAEIDALPTEFLWPGHLARGWVTLIAGDGAVGKGRMLCSLAGIATRGDAWPGEDPKTTHPWCHVIMVTPEDDENEQMAPRLIASGAVLGRVVNFTYSDDGAPFELPESVGALRALADTLRKDGHPVLVIIDPLMSVISRSISSNLGARKVMAPLMRFAKETGAAVALVHHTVKSGSVAGSKGLTDVLRCVFKVSRDPSDPEIRVIHLEKGNDLPASEDTRYTIATGPQGPHVVWLNRETTEARRTSWRTSKPQTDSPPVHTPAAQPVAKPQGWRMPRSTASLVYVADRAEVVPGQPSVTVPMGTYASLPEAQLACGAHLTWRPYGDPAQGVLVASTLGRSYAIAPKAVYSPV